MQRGNYPPNPYCNRAPFNNGDNGFRSPPFYYKSPPGSSPRFNQQFVPHHNSARWQSPRYSHAKNQRRMDSPYRSPNQNSFEFKTPGSQGSGQRLNFSSDSSSSFSWHTPDGNSNRGRFTPGSNKHSPWKSSPRNFTSPQNDNCNPGGSNDITLYYSPDMVQDPWANLKPVPVKKTT